ncbi:hypothetical protein [Streptomyces sp. NPDC015125]|uniref:hypothetical protein n=1 Tax=Streptomyces sp. NPDC015125 TaxID=3364938 RepID=UPI0036FD9DF4
MPDAHTGERTPDDSLPAVPGRTLRTGLPGLPPLAQAATDRPGVTVGAVCGGSPVLTVAGLLRHLPDRPAARLQGHRPSPYH